MSTFPPLTNSSMYGNNSLRRGQILAKMEEGGRGWWAAIYSLFPVSDFPIPCKLSGIPSKYLPAFQIWKNFPSLKRSTRQRAHGNACCSIYCHFWDILVEMEDFDFGKFWHFYQVKYPKFADQKCLNILKWKKAWPEMVIQNCLNILMSDFLSGSLLLIYTSNKIIESSWIVRILYRIGL